MAEQTPIILKNVTKNYGKSRGIDNVSLEIKPGEVFGFLGPNGAGKSTTIRSILDFLRPNSGEIFVLGKSTKNPAYVKIRKDIGYLAGDIALYEKMTGRQLLTFFDKLGFAINWGFVAELVDRFDAELDRKIKHLSKGNRQKIGLIQAFAHQPKLVILDEPTSGLDPLMKQAFYDLVLETKQRGATVFVSSHDLTEVRNICDRAAFIRDGKIIAIEDISNTARLDAHQYVAECTKKPDLKKLTAMPNVSGVKLNGHTLLATVHGDVADFVAELALARPQTLSERQLDLEDVFMHYYQEDK